MGKREQEWERTTVGNYGWFGGTIPGFEREARSVKRETRPGYEKEMAGKQQKSCNSETELADESVGGWRRLSGIKGWSNREEQRGEPGQGGGNRNGEKEGQLQTRAATGGRRNTTCSILYRYFHGRTASLVASNHPPPSCLYPKPVPLPLPPFVTPSTAPLASYLFVTVSLVSHEPINIFFDVQRIN